MFLSVPSSNSWQSVTPLNKGWSTDRKYLVTPSDGVHLLLRVNDFAKYDAKEKEFEIIRKFAGLGFPLSRPLEFGICDEGRSVYMLLTWVEGWDLTEVLPSLPDADQYRLGREAGKILRLIHSLPVEAADIPETTKKARKLLQLERYETSQVRIPDDEPIVQYVKDHIDLIWRQPPVYQHGDFHPGNLIYRSDGSLGVIDFNRWEVGDPYEEFYKLQSFGCELSIPYCIGQINAYFNDDIPDDFWPTLAVYVAHASISSIKWAERFGADEIAGMVRRYRIALDDFDNFRRTVPKWFFPQ